MGTYAVAGASDFNNDGLTDLYLFRSDGANRKKTTATTQLDRIWLAVGDGTFTEVVIPEANGFPNEHRIASGGDFDGDGNFDFYNNKADPTTARAAGEPGDQIRFGRIERPDLILAVTNGLGNKVEVEYGTLSDPAVYTRGTGSVYPVAEVGAPVEVVHKVKTDNGIGGINTQTHTYEAMREHLRGGGGLGFKKTRMIDDSTGIVSESEYSQDYATHLQGSLIAGKTIAPVPEGAPPGTLGVVLEAKTVTWIADNLGTPGAPDHRFLHRAPISTTTKRDLNGALFGTVTEEVTTDTYGFATQHKTTTSNGTNVFTKTTVNTYAHYWSTWLLGRLTSATSTHTAPGRPDEVRNVAFTYFGATGLLRTETVEPASPLFTRKTYTHNGFGAVTAITETWGSTATDGIGPASRTTSFTYDANSRFKLTETNPLGHTSTTVYHDVHGLPISTTGPNGLTTSWTYDTFGNMTVETRADGTLSRNYRYLCDDNTPCPLYGKYVLVSWTQGAPLKAVYKDKLNRTIRETGQSLNGSLVDIDIVHNARGEVVQKSEPTFDGEALLGPPTAPPPLPCSQPGALCSTVIYDLLGRPTLTTRADGATQSILYNGATVTSTNERGQKKTVVSDSLGRMIASRDDHNKDVIFRYDAIGNQISIQHPDSTQLTTTTYDIRGNKVATSDPDRGSWTYVYNALGMIVSQTDAKGQVTTSTYDVLGRMLTRVDDATAPLPAERTATWVYDTAPMGIGKLTSASGYGYSSTNTYDTLGRPVSVTETVDSSTYTISSTYDAFSRPSTTTYPSGLVVRSDYSPISGGVYRIRKPGTTTYYWTALSVDERGNVTSSQLGNGVTETRSYQPANGFLTAIYAQAANAGPVIQNHTYTFDALANLEQRKDERQNLTETFEYDTLNRVTEIVTTAGAVTTTVSVTYDARGNIVSRSDVGAYTYGAADACGAAGPHAVKAIAAGSVVNGKTASYCYDPNGDMTSGDDRTVTWSAFGMPVHMARGSRSVTIAYGPSRARFKRTDDNETGITTTHYIAGGAYEVSTNQAGQVTSKTYVAGVAVVIDTLTAGQHVVQTQYLLKDHLGSVDVVTSSAGAVVERMSFDAWGKRRKLDWTAYLPSESYDWQSSFSARVTKGFTGHEELDPVGLVHMNGRVYDAEIGRFLSADPFIQDPSNSQALNAYTYVNNNPLSFTDPSGFFLSGLFKAIGNAIRSALRSIGRALKAAVKSQIGRALLQMIACTGGPHMCAFASAAITLAAGGGPGDALVAFVTAFAQVQVYSGIHVSLASSGLTGAAALGAKVATHAVVGGAFSVAQGGSFSQGAAAGAVSGAVGFVMENTPLGQSKSYEAMVARAAIQAAAGGTASVLSGGKFANGAITGAMAQLYNDSGLAIIEAPGYQVSIEFEASWGTVGEIGAIGVGILGVGRAAIWAGRLLWGGTATTISGFTTAESAVIIEARGILGAAEFASLRAAHAAGVQAEVTIGGRTIVYVPGLPGEGMSLFGEGFALGPRAFASNAELGRTVLHEVYRLTHSASASGVSAALASQETAAAAGFASRAFKVLGK